MQLLKVLRTFRPPFLVLSLVCVFLGFSTSLTTQSPINYFIFFLVLLGAISAHISVNTLNEYFDFKSGLDLITEKTRFSGGSGALPASPGMAGPILAVGLVSLMVTVVIGIYFILERGPQIAPIGLLGIVLIATYTQWLNRSPLLCLIAPGLGFGILMVVGTHVVLTGTHSRLAWLVSLVPFFLINNLLLLNQYPDTKADASVGRHTFPISFGFKKSNFMYALFMTAAYSSVLIFLIRGLIPKLGIIALTPVAFSLFSLVGAAGYSSDSAGFSRTMGANVAAAILTPLLLGLSIIYG